MNVTVNGDRAARSDGCTVQRLVDDTARVDARRGRGGQRRGRAQSSWPSHRLLEGDRVEVLTAAQGG